MLIFCIHTGACAPLVAAPNGAACATVQDQQLRLSVVTENSKNWKKIASNLPGRTDVQVCSASQWPAVVIVVVALLVLAPVAKSLEARPC